MNKKESKFETIKLRFSLPFVIIEYTMKKSSFASLISIFAIIVAILIAIISQPYELLRQIDTETLGILGLTLLVLGLVILLAQFYVIRKTPKSFESDIKDELIDTYLNALDNSEIKPKI